MDTKLYSLAKYTTIARKQSYNSGKLFKIEKHVHWTGKSTEVFCHVVFFPKSYRHSHKGTFFSHASWALAFDLNPIAIQVSLISRKSVRWEPINPINCSLQGWRPSLKAVLLLGDACWATSYRLLKQACCHHCIYIKIVVTTIHKLNTASSSLFLAD